MIWLLMLRVTRFLQFGQVETIAAGLIDEYPDVLRPNRKLFTLFMCVVMFLLGIPMISQGGIYIVTLLDWFTLLVSFSIISLFELVAVMYIYGALHDLPPCTLYARKF